MIMHACSMALSLGLLLALHAFVDYYSSYAQALPQPMLIQEELLDGVSSAGHGKISITGRKMLGQLLVSRSEIKRKEWLKGDSSFVISSEEGNEASNKYLQGSKLDQLNAQLDQLRTLARSTDDDDEQVVEIKANDSSKEDETRRLLEATKEIVSLMQQDYRRYARRKPPINNHEPYH